MIAQVEIRKLSDIFFHRRSFRVIGYTFIPEDQENLSIWQSWNPLGSDLGFYQTYGVTVNPLQPSFCNLSFVKKTSKGLSVSDEELKHFVVLRNRFNFRKLIKFDVAKVPHNEAEGPEFKVILKVKDKNNTEMLPYIFMLGEVIQ